MPKPGPNPYHPRWRRRHEAVLRYVLEHPCAQRPEIAAANGYSVDHISRIMGLADFQARYEDFNERHVKPAILARSMDRLTEVADKNACNSQNFPALTGNR